MRLTPAEPAFSKSWVISTKVCRMVFGDWANSIASRTNAAFSAAKSGDREGRRSSSSVRTTDASEGVELKGDEGRERSSGESDRCFDRTRNDVLLFPR